MARRHLILPDTQIKPGVDTVHIDWAANAIKAVGNYGEIFDRNLGQSSPLKIARGLNALWTKGGIQFGPPVR